MSLKNKQYYYPALLALLYIVSSYFLMKFDGTDAGNWDNQSYAYAGYSLLHNGVYKAAWVDKPPLAFIAFLPTLVLDPIRGMNAYFCIVVSAVSYLLFCLLLRLKFTHFEAAVGAIAVFQSSLWMPDVNWLSLSHLGNLIAIVSLLVYGIGNKTSFFLAGVIAISSFFVRQNSILFILLPLLVFRIEGALAIYIKGLFAGFLFWSVLFYLISDHELFLDTTFFYPSRYAHISRIGADLPSITSIAGKFFSVVSSIAIAFCIFSILAVRRRTVNFSTARVAAILVLLFAMCLLPGKPWLHYLAYMMLGFGIFYAWGATILREALPWVRFYPAIALLIVVTCLVQNTQKLTAEKDSGENINAVLRISGEIQRASRNLSAKPSVQVFCNGYAAPIGAILRISGAVPVNPLFHAIYYTKDFAEAIPAAFKGGWGMLEQNPPQILVYCPEQMKDLLGEDVRPKVEKLIRDNGYAEFSTFNDFKVLTRH